MDAALLGWLHGHSTLALDAVFRFSSELGLGLFCVPLVLALIVWHLVRGERREAIAWALVGVATWLLPELVKHAVRRPRPHLWPHLIRVSGFSFPSGHAVAGAALYPLLGWVALRGRPGRGRWGYATGLAVGAFVGVGRCYLGVHWPSDVLAGWVLGTALSAAAVLWLARAARAAGEASPGAPRSPSLDSPGWLP